MELNTDFSTKGMTARNSGRGRGLAGGAISQDTMFDCSARVRFCRMGARMQDEAGCLISKGADAKKAGGWREWPIADGRQQTRRAAIAPYSVSELWH